MIHAKSVADGRMSVFKDMSGPVIRDGKLVEVRDLKDRDLFQDSYGTMFQVLQKKEVHFLLTFEVFSEEQADKIQEYLKDPSNYYRSEGPKPVQRYYT